MRLPDVTSSYIMLLFTTRSTGCFPGSFLLHFIESLEIPCRHIPCALKQLIKIIRFLISYQPIFSAVFAISTQLFQGSLTNFNAMNKLSYAALFVSFSDILLCAPRGIPHLRRKSRLSSSKFLGYFLYRPPDFTNILIELQFLIGCLTRHRNLMQHYVTFGNIM